jgi:preprotein translocase subunit SecE
MEQVQSSGSSNRVVAWLRASWQFVMDANAELKKVTWPTRPELIDATKRVIILTLAIGVVLGVLDRILTWILVDGIAAIAR